MSEPIKRRGFLGMLAAITSTAAIASEAPAARPPSATVPLSVNTETGHITASIKGAERELGIRMMSATEEGYAEAQAFHERMKRLEVRPPWYVG